MAIDHSYTDHNLAQVLRILKKTRNKSATAFMAEINKRMPDLSSRELSAICGALAIGARRSAKIRIQHEGICQLPNEVQGQILELSCEHRVDLNSVRQIGDQRFLIGHAPTELVIIADRNGAKMLNQGVKKYD